MTLNLTVTTQRCIYQSADFRLRDWATGELRDFETQKIALVNRFRWTATVCFAGVGRTLKVNVGDWLAERIAAIEHEDPFDRLLDELLTADGWLSDTSLPDNRHSFSVGAFVGTEPVFALVSNFETLFAPPPAECKVATLGVPDAAITAQDFCRWSGESGESLTAQPVGEISSRRPSASSYV